MIKNKVDKGILDAVNKVEVPNLKRYEHQVGLESVVTNTIVSDRIITENKKKGNVGELPISSEYNPRYNSLSAIHRMSSLGGVIGGVVGLLYSSFNGIDALPEVAKGVAYGIAIPYVILSAAYYIKNELSGINNEI